MFHEFVHAVWCDHSLCCLCAGQKTSKSHSGNLALSRTFTCRGTIILGELVLHCLYVYDSPPFLNEDKEPRIKEVGVITIRHHISVRYSALYSQAYPFHLPELDISYFSFWESIHFIKFFLSFDINICSDICLLFILYWVLFLNFLLCHAG